MSAHEAPAGTLRAAVETLTVDLIATTHAQVQLVKAVQALDRLAGGMLTTTAELREACGIPITDQELQAGCDCPHCKSKRAATPAN